MSNLLPYANLAISWGLFILIWLVQLIIYPGFHRIPAELFVSYHRWYVIRISAVVLPLMVAELILTIWWVLSDAYSPISLSAGFFVSIVWLSTFMFQVPIHNRLKAGRENILVRRLVTTNWIRTVAWTLKTGIVSIHTIGGIAIAP